MENQFSKTESNIPIIFPSGKDHFERLPAVCNGFFGNVGIHGIITSQTNAALIFPAVETNNKLIETFTGDKK